MLRALGMLAAGVLLGGCPKAFEQPPPPRPQATWMPLGRNALVDVSVERALYERPGSRFFYMHEKQQQSYRYLLVTMDGHLRATDGVAALQLGAPAADDDRDCAVDAPVVWRVVPAGALVVDR